MSTYVPIQNQFRISHPNDFIPLGGHFKRLFDTIKQDQINCSQKGALWTELD